MRWRWSSVDKAWYRWYDGKWHYWGISKRGFTYNGWSWYAGYWHYKGYVYKWNRPYWYRFVNRQWVRYTRQIPIQPSKPRAKVCRPVYRLLKAGTPTSVSNQYIPRCKVGRNIYMYSDYDGCKFLGGKKVMQKRLVCKTGKQHRWARMTKCIYYYKSGKGLDYKTGKLKRSSYKFDQCQIYRDTKKTDRYYWFVNGKCHLIPKDKHWKTYYSIFKSGAKYKILSRSQISSCTKGRAIKKGSYLLKSNKGHTYLKNWKVQPISKKSLGKCQINMKKLTSIKEKSLLHHKLGDIIGL